MLMWYMLSFSLQQHDCQVITTLLIGMISSFLLLHFFLVNIFILIIYSFELDWSYDVGSEKLWDFGSIHRCYNWFYYQELFSAIAIVKEGKAYTRLERASFHKILQENYKRGREKYIPLQTNENVLIFYGSDQIHTPLSVEKCIIWGSNPHFYVSTSLQLSTQLYLW